MVLEEREKELRSIVKKEQWLRGERKGRKRKRNCEGRRNETLIW